MKAPHLIQVRKRFLYYRLQGNRFAKEERCVVFRLYAVWKLKVVKDLFVKTTKETGIQLLDNEGRHMKRYEIYIC